MVTYPNARDEQGRDINIKDVKPETREQTKFYCWGCGKRMMAVLKGEMQPHFRHFEECECRGETYIHNRAKYAFKDTYVNSDSFIIELKGQARCQFFDKCAIASVEGCSKEAIFKHDLKHFFDTAEVEKTDGDFRPDILLSSSSESSRKMYIEIFHTNESSDKKLTSGNKIVEITVNNEKDIKIIHSAHLKESDSVKFIGFKQQVEYKELFERYNLILFWVDSDGRAHFSSNRCGRLLPGLAEGLHFARYGILTKESTIEVKDHFIKHCMNTAWFKGILNPDCRMCRFLGDYRGGSGFEYHVASCGKNGFETDNTDYSPYRAETCPNFELDLKHAGAYDVFRELNEYYECDSGKDKDFRKVVMSTFGEVEIWNTLQLIEIGESGLTKAEIENYKRIPEMLKGGPYINLEPEYVYQTIGLALKRRCLVSMTIGIPTQLGNGGKRNRFEDSIRLCLRPVAPDMISEISQE